MGTFFLLILIIFVVFILWPIIKVWWTLQNARRQAREFFGQKSQDTRGSQYGAGADAGRHPRGRRKIIDADVGEYVEFEEVSTFTRTQAEDGTSNVKYETEEQITDVEWTDIK